MSKRKVMPEIHLSPEDTQRLASVLASAPLAAAPPLRLRRSPLVSRRRLLCGGLVALALAGGLIRQGPGGGLAPPAIAAVAVVPDPPEPEAIKSAWTEINQPIHLYALPAPELDKKVKTYSARRHLAGAGRQDLLGFGESRGQGAFLRLNIYRFGSEDAQPVSMFVELARRTADDGFAVLRSGQPTALSTRFGTFQVADALLAGKTGENACLGYRLEAPVPGLRISGYGCGTAAIPLDRAALACVLDRLDLVSAGDDTELRRFFVDAERRRGVSCGGGHVAGTTVKPNWLTPATSLPALRGTETTGAIGKRKAGKA